MTKSGQNLWEKAKKIIPGGNQLLSKRSELFLPGFWPAYYKKAKGCTIWDLDNTQYYDFAGMGVTACVLGYADDDIDSALFNYVENHGKPLFELLKTMNEDSNRKILFISGEK